MTKATLNGSYLMIDGRRYNTAGYLDLRGTSIMELPDNLTVGGHLDLEGTSIMELPDNLTVGGYLDLFGTSITELPDNLTVGGYLDLRGTSIMELPDNLTVGGHLDLRGTSITEPGIFKRPAHPLTWQNGKYILVDGILSEVIHRRGNVVKTKHIAKEELGYIVTDGNGNWAHGGTLEAARDDLMFKISYRHKSDYEGLGLDHVFTLQEAIEAYRVITGACAAGVKQFVLGQERKDEYSIQEIIDITQGQFGHDTFASFFEVN